MNIDDLVNRIKKDGYSSPKIAVITPEIRTIDVSLQRKVDDERFEFLEEDNIIEE